MYIVEPWRCYIVSWRAVGSTFLVLLGSLTFTPHLGIATDDFESEVPPVACGADVGSAALQDNPVNQMVASRILRSLGCEFVVVDNGRKAVTACREGRFDVVLMDCHMPELVSRTDQPCC